MRIVIQRVKYASVTVDGKICAKIDQGLMALVGFCQEDSSELLEPMAEKMINLRIFSDAEDKMNLSLKDVGGELLAVSQFTLYADCVKGRRPSFNLAKGGEEASRLYDSFVEICRQKLGKDVGEGIFGADMKVELLNDGPVTIILDSDEIVKRKNN